MIMILKWFLVLGVLLPLPVVAQRSMIGQAEPDNAPAFGVLVMAHGGDSSWNASVGAMTGLIAARVPTVVALGMADPSTLGAGLDSLAALGVSRVAVVRAFVSGRSFLPQTKFLLGLSAERPAWFMTDPHNHTGQVAPLDHRLTVATHSNGLMDSPGIHRIVRERVREPGATPGGAGVLVVAHGMGDEAENDEVVAQLQIVRRDLEADGFGPVAVETLREDWPTLRSEAEHRMRAFAREQAMSGRALVVVPFRLSGFGPYASILEGYTYSATEGFLPHAAIARWVASTAWGVACEQGWVVERIDPDIDGTAHPC